MANRVVISICGEEYTFVADEAAGYMQKVGSYVNEKMSEILEGSKVGRTDAAVLTAVNITDELFKAQTTAEQLRSQIKGYLDQASKAQAEVSELKREVFRLQQRLDKKRDRNFWRPPDLRSPSALRFRTARTRSISVGENSTPAEAQKTLMTRSLRTPWFIVMPGVCGYSSP